MGSSELCLPERLPGLDFWDPICETGKDIVVVPLGVDIEPFTGEVVGVFFDVDCLGDFDPKFQNEWDFFVGEVAGEDVFVLPRSLLCNTFGCGGAIALRSGVFNSNPTLLSVLCVGASEAEYVELADEWRDECVPP